MTVSGLITDNIKDTKVTNYLKDIGIEKSADEKGMELSLWLTKLVNENRVSEEILNNCFWNELMYGHRRFIRCYEIKAVRKIKHEEDWKKFLRTFNCPGINFNQILQTTLQTGETEKVCAMKTIFENGEIKKVNILFVYNMGIIYRTTNSRDNCYSYIPVTFDLEQKTMVIKVWNKDDAIQGDFPREQLDYIVEQLKENLDFENKSIKNDPQQVLYKMSKSLFDHFFMHLPNNIDVEQKRENLSKIVNELLENISLSNSEIVNNMKTMNSEVINVEEELFKLIQQIALYDYLKDNNIKSLLQNTDTYISRIRFSDRDNLTASLTSETGVKCIFDAKTFMCVRNSLDLVERIVSIVVTFVNNSGKGLLSVKYDASDHNYLNIHILNSKYYTDDDFKMIWELYEQYESDNTTEVNTVYNEDDAEAM